MSKKVTDKMFKESVYSLVKDEYTILTPYVKARTKVLIRHNSDVCKNHEYEATPNKFLMGRRCPKCAVIIRAQNSHWVLRVLRK